MPPKRKSLPTELDDKTRKPKMVKKMEPPKTWKEAEYSAKLESEYKDPIKYDEYMEGGIPDSLLEGLGFSETEVPQDSSGAGADDDDDATGAEPDQGVGGEPLRSLDPSSLTAQGLSEAMSSYVVDQISAMAKSGLISATLPQQIVDFTLAASNKAMATAASQAAAQVRKPVPSSSSSTSPVRTSRRLSARNNTPAENTMTVDSSRSASRLYTPTPVVRPTPPRAVSQFAAGTRPMPISSSVQPPRQPLPPRNTRVYNTAPRTITKGNIVYERMPTGEVIASLIKKPDGSGRQHSAGDSAQRASLTSSSYRGVPTSSASPITFDDCPINEYNVGEVLEKSIKATQSMRMLLTSLRDDLRRIGAGGTAMVTEEQVRKRQEVADKLTKAYATYKRSIEDIEMPQDNTKAAMATHRSDKSDLPWPVMLVKHGIPIGTGGNEHGGARRGASATVTGPAARRAQDRGEVIELSESDDDNEQNGHTSRGEGNRFSKTASGRQRSDGVRSGDVGKRSLQKDEQCGVDATEAKAGKPDSTDAKQKECNGVKGSADEKK